MTSAAKKRLIARTLLATVLAAGLVSAPAWVDAGHGPAKGKAGTAMPHHQGSKPDNADGNPGAMKNNAPTALLMPIMDPARGRKVFAVKGCVGPYEPLRLRRQDVGRGGGDDHASGGGAGRKDLAHRAGPCRHDRFRAQPHGDRKVFEKGHPAQDLVRAAKNPRKRPLELKGM